jgi:hypothetical protein
MLHIFVESGMFYYLPNNANIIMLHITVCGEDQSFDLSSPLCDNIANFCETLYIPIVDNFNIKIQISAECCTFANELISLGSCILDVTSNHHGISQNCILSTIDTPDTGIIGLRFFCYQKPMDINTFKTSSGRQAISQHNKFLKEYQFLRNRKLYWKGDKQSTWHRETEKLLDEDPSLQFNKSFESEELYNKKYNKCYFGKAKKITASISNNVNSSSPKLRKTSFSNQFHTSSLSSSTSPLTFSLTREDDLKHKLDSAEKRRNEILKEHSNKIHKYNVEKETQFKQRRMKMLTTSTLHSQRYSTNKGRINGDNKSKSDIKKSIKDVLRSMDLLDMADNYGKLKAVVDYVVNTSESQKNLSSTANSCKAVDSKDKTKKTICNKNNPTKPNMTSNSKDKSNNITSNKERKTKPKKMKKCKSVKSKNSTSNMNSSTNSLSKDHTRLALGKDDEKRNHHRYIEPQHIDYIDSNYFDDPHGTSLRYSSDSIAKKNKVNKLWNDWVRDNNLGSSDSDSSFLSEDLEVLNSISKTK